LRLSNLKNGQQPIVSEQSTDDQVVSVTTRMSETIDLIKTVNDLVDSR